MLALSSGLLSLSCLASLAIATIAPRFPTESDSCVGGAECSLRWINDGDKPHASEFGKTTVGLFVGSTDTQVQIQDFGTIDDPSEQSALRPRIEASAGEDADFYFIRFESINAKADDGYPLQAFSARFTLTGMTGQFSSDAQAAIDSAKTKSQLTTSSRTQTTTSSAKTSSISTSTPALKASDEDDSSASVKSTVASGAALFGAAAVVVAYL